MRTGSYVYNFIDKHESEKKWRNQMLENNTANKLTHSLLVIYIVVLFWILLFKLGVHFSYMGNERSINLVPFGESSILNGKIDFSEIVLNVLIFIPLGVYAGVLFKRWIIGKKLFLFFLISLLIEGFQFILAVGAFDITDIINNTLGGIIGLLLYTGIEKVFENSVKAQKTINIIATIGTVSMVLFLFLLKTNRLWITYQ